MTTQTPATAEMEKWLCIWFPFFTDFWLRIRVRKKNAESRRSPLRQSGSGPTSAARPALCLVLSSSVSQPPTCGLVLIHVILLLVRRREVCMSCTRLRILLNTICRKPGFNSLRTLLNHGAEQASNETLKQTQQRNDQMLPRAGKLH